MGPSPKNAFRIDLNTDRDPEEIRASVFPGPNDCYKLINGWLIFTIEIAARQVQLYLAVIYMKNVKRSAVWCFLLPLVLAMSLCAEGETVQQTAQSYIAMGENFATHRDWVRAIGAYTIALQFTPKSAQAFFRRGQAFEGQGDTAKAIADYSTAVVLEPALGRAWYNRGNLRLKSGDYEAALSDLSNAVERDPLYARAYNNRGIARVARGNFDGGMADFAEAIKLDPNDPQPYVNRGLLLFRQGLKMEAEKDFARSVAINPSLKSFIDARLSHAAFTPVR